MVLIGGRVVVIWLVIEFGDFVVFFCRGTGLIIVFDFLQFLKALALAYYFLTFLKNLKIFEILPASFCEFFFFLKID